MSSSNFSVKPRLLAAIVSCQFLYGCGGGQGLESSNASGDAQLSASSSQSQNATSAGMRLEHVRPGSNTSSPATGSSTVAVTKSDTPNAGVISPSTSPPAGPNTTPSPGLYAPSPYNPSTNSPYVSPPNSPNTSPIPGTPVDNGPRTVPPVTTNDFCTSGTYPAQWAWNPATTQNQPLAATSGTPRIDHIRNGVVIASYTSLGGDGGYSWPDNTSGIDNSVGPFRRKPYTQWQAGDVFEIYPAVYSGANMQIYLGPNIANDAAFITAKYDVPANITIRGKTVDGHRPVIVNPPTGGSNSNYGQSLVYIDALYDQAGTLITPSTNITIENIDVVDSPTGGFLGKAAVYVNGGLNVTLRNMRISGFKQHSANGIFGTVNNGGTLLLENVELDSNGGSGGPEHNAYINASANDPNFTFAVRGSWSHDSYYGHALKSRAQNTIVEGSYLSGSRATSTTQTETYLLDVPDGGTLVARNNIFVKNFSGNNSNGASLTFGVESASLTRKWGLTIEHNTFVAFSRYYDDSNHQLFPMFIGDSAPGTRDVNYNNFIGYCPTGNPGRDFRGANFATLNFNDIDLEFHPLTPQLTGDPNIIGTPQYAHVGRTTLRTTKALGARD